MERLTMEINRTGSRNAPLENPAQKIEPTAAGFKSSSTQSVDTDASSHPTAVPAGITRADLRDPGKSEEILNHCFGDMIDKASSDLGVPVSETQRRSVLEFLGNDPVTRGKLLSYLDQT